MKTIKILPKVNNIDFAGRVYNTPSVNKAKTRVNFSLIRNFGGDKDPVILDFILFLKKGVSVPEILVKGAVVIVHAYFNPDVYTNADGEQVRKTQFVVKSVEPAEVTKGVLPGVNNIDFAGRLTADAYLNSNGTCAMFTLIRNFGGEKAPVALDFAMLRKKDGPAFPAGLTKGSPMKVRAYFSPAVYTDKNGDEVRKIQFLVKEISPAEMVEREVEDDTDPKTDAEPIDLGIGEDIDIIES